MHLAIETNQLVALILGGVCVAALVLIVVAPWRKVRSEPKIPDEVETRLLLGDDPVEIAEEEDEAERRESREGPRAEILDLDPERRSSASG
jgi:hypothetical protein